MFVVPHLPPKAQFLEDFSFPLIAVWCTPKRTFEGGRPCYDKEKLLFWLLVKRSQNWDYRTIAAMAGVSHPTLMRANKYFLEQGIYQKVFTHLVKKAYQQKLIKGEKVALDSSFVETFSKKEELGSEGYNGHKKGFGFKLHLLIDAETKFPVALIIGNGIAHDSTLAVPLLKKARAWLRKVKYVLGDKGYDDSDLVNWILKELKAKAGIPMRKKSKLAKGKTHRYGNYENWKMKAVGRTFKKSILGKRTEIERCFAHLKRVFHLGKEEMRGILNFAKNVYQSLICYMLKQFKLAGISYL